MPVDRMTYNEDHFDVRKEMTDVIGQQHSWLRAVLIARVMRPFVVVIEVAWATITWH